MWGHFSLYTLIAVLLAATYAAPIPHKCSEGSVPDTSYQGLQIFSSIPVCIVVKFPPPPTKDEQNKKCEALSSVSRNAVCYYQAKEISCNNSLLQMTTAKLSCSEGYNPVLSDYAPYPQWVICNGYGQWAPDLIQCVAASPKSAPKTAGQKSESKKREEQNSSKQ